MDQMFNVNQRQPMTTQEEVGGTKRGPTNSRTGKTASLSPDNRKYWEQRLYRKSWTWKGESRQSSTYYFRVKSDRREYRVDLGLSNKQEAAALARDLYVQSRKEGWQAAIASHRAGEGRRRGEEITVGDLLKEFDRVSSAAPETRRDYKRALRRIVAGIRRLDGGKKKYGKRGSEELRAKADATPLRTITPESIELFRKRFLGSTEGDPLALQSAKVSFNSYLRMSRSLFSKRLAKHYPFEIPSETVQAFAETRFEREGDLRYRSEVNAEQMLKWAGNDLRESSPEQYTALLLFLLAGLRRREADLLTWPQVRFQDGVIRIEPTRYFTPKSEKSCGDVPVPEELLDWLRSRMPNADGPFVINSPLEFDPKRQRDWWPGYRCDPVFKGLISWLRSKGVTADKPIHSLRKEYGSMLNEKAGIHVASRLLRHADLAVTSRYYTDNRRTVDLGLGRLIAGG